MSYAQNKLLDKQLPSYAGFFVLLVALGITLLLSGNTFMFISKATAGSEPKNIQISNISDTSFTISYTTDVPTVGTVSYGTSPSMPDIALDDRDKKTGSAAEHQVHFITVEHATPSTKYYYVIDSGSQKTTNNGSPFIVTTAKPLTNAATTPPLAGTVALSNGTIPTEGIVYLTGGGLQQLATLINPDGSYQIPLAQLRNSNLSTAASLTSDTMLTLQAVTPTQQSVAKVLFDNTNPVPEIILPQNYDFTLGRTTKASGAAQVTSGIGFPVFTTPAPVSSPVIDTPRASQAFTDQQPTFQGRALPNTEVDIIIQSQQEISVKLHSNNSGNWQFRPPLKLAPGKHTITIKSINAAGILQTISRSFIVYASGSHFIAPSVSPIATIIPTAIPTTTPVPTAAATPTAIPKPTVTPTPTKTAITPTKTPLPKTGSSAAITGTITGISILGIGALLFFAL